MTRSTKQPIVRIAPTPRRHRVALVVDPRFPGGTGTAVAAEIRALAPVVDLRVVALDTAMFKRRDVNPAVAAALDAHGLPLHRDVQVVHADTIVVHNPSSFRFDTALPMRLSCAEAIVVTHENFLRPGGREAFDVGGCLDLLETALICGRRWLAPVSAHNRATVAAWLKETSRAWDLLPFDWSNIVDEARVQPTSTPRDRRGRHSRPGFEKFPSTSAMAAHFPASAEACIILGGDAFLAAPADLPQHWDVRPFGSTAVSRFLEEIDFFVYFTNPLWRESFGRVVAEAIAAGKVVITDVETATSFTGAVVASTGGDVDDVIEGFIAAPERYRAFVEAAQRALDRFAPETFTAKVLAHLDGERRPRALV